MVDKADVKTDMALAKVNEYKVQRKNDDGSMTITLPKQFVVDNKIVTGDRVAVYRNAMDPAELVVRVEKKNQTKP